MNPSGSAQRGLSLFHHLLPEALGRTDTETQMRGRLFAIIVVATIPFALNAATTHFSNGAADRAYLILACALPAVATLGLAKSKGRLQIALSLFLGILLMALVAGPALSEDAIPISVAASTIPILAAAVGGLSLGILWTVVTLLVVGVAALSVRADPAASLVVGNTLIVAGAGGFGCSLLEMLRRREHQNAQLATEETQIELKKRILAEANLEQSKTIISESFKQSPSLFLLGQFPSMRIVDVNESFERIAGWSMEEVRGRTLEDLGAWNSPDDRKSLLESMRAQGKTKQAEIRLRNRRGEPIWLLGAASRIELGGQPYVLAQAIDITERKAAAEALMRNRDVLKTRLDQNDAALRNSTRKLAEHRHLVSVGTLAAGIAHQINNPIGAIMAAAEFSLALDEDDPEREKVRKEALQTAVSESQRCGRIVHNLLRFARHEPTARWVENITPLVGRAIELSRAYVLENGGQLQTEITNEPLYTMISPIELEQTLVNLLRNSAESLDGHGKIEVRTTRIEDSVEIEVRDDGCGIGEEELQHVFEPFYTTRLQEGGTGLGLSFAHGVTSSHGGELILDSTPEKGTRARLRLQLVPPPAAA